MFAELFFGISFYKRNFDVVFMSKANKKFSYFLNNPAISIAVLVGFLCIQLHSFSHIDLSPLSPNELAHQTENTSSQITGHSTSGEEVILECPDCVLTKHLQADIKQDAVLFLSNALEFSVIYTDAPLLESVDYLFLLRAPPFYTV